MSENANPERGCGTKTAGATYAEGPEESAGGVLNRWSYLLSDGYLDFMPISVPPRQMVIINPAATIYTRSLVKTVLPGFGERFEDKLASGYTKLLKKTKNQGVADHVGEKYYSAHSFAQEIKHYGPSRRIPKSIAERLIEIIWQRGPIPMIFTHNRMPIFKGSEQVAQAVDHVRKCLGHFSSGEYGTDWYEWGPTWRHEDWSQYSDGYHGYNHVLVDVLELIHELDNNWRKRKKEPFFEEAKEFFTGLRYVEQAFGAAWLGRITHCADKDGNYDEDFLKMRDKHGGVMVNLIDLNELEEEE